MSRLVELVAAFLRSPERPIDAFEAALGLFLGPDVQVFTYFKGRVALHAVGRALRLAPGDEVVLPGYSCFVVPEALRPFGVRPVYVDVDPGTYCTPSAALLAVVGPRTRLVVVQHTYGIPAPAGEIATACRERGVPVVEDACHSFGTTVSGLLAGCAGSAGFFSGQWNKPINTGLGGILVVRDPALAKRIREDRASAVRPGRAEALQLRLLMLAHASLVGPRTYPLAQAAYRALSASGIVAGSSSPEEMAGRLPEDYFKLMSAAQAQAGLAEARHFAAGVRARAALQDLYPRMLAAAGFDPPTLPPGTVLSRYPVRVDRKPEVVAAAARLGIEIGTWFETPLHPLPMERHREHGYIAGACPRAEEAAAQVVNLPIRRTTTGSEAERCVDFLARHARPARPA